MSSDKDILGVSTSLLTVLALAATSKLWVLGLPILLVVDAVEELRSQGDSPQPPMQISQPTLGPTPFEKYSCNHVDPCRSLEGFTLLAQRSLADNEIIAIYNHPS